MANNIFITGRIRSGKSTLLKEMIDPMKNLIGGFFVQRLFIDNESKAFRMVDISKENYLPNRDVESLEGMADLMAITGEGKTIFYDVFRTVGVEALRKASESKQLVLMDELGKMEIDILEFTQMVFDVLDKEVPVLGIIKKDDNLFLEKIRRRSDVTVLDLDYIKREIVKAKIRDFITPLSKSIAEPINGIYD